VFCDVRRDRVWRLARNGELTDILPDTHCRGLVLGPDGYVYGESSTAAATVDASTGTTRADTLGIWRVGLSGRPAWVQPPITAPEPSLWIVTDGKGRSYGWNGALPRTTLSQIVTRQGPAVNILAGGAWGQKDGLGLEAQFGRVAGLALAPDGSLVVADSGNIRRVSSDGRVTTESVGTVTDSDHGVAGKLGLWDRTVGVATDADGAAVVVDREAGRIARIARDGTATTLWSSRWGWRPTGVAMTATGFYVLEDLALPSMAADMVGSPRVRFVDRNGSSRTIVSVSSLMMRGLGALTLVILFSAIRSRRRRAKPAWPTPPPAGGLQ
jgi:hypothetical protein